MSGIVNYAGAISEIERKRDKLVTGLQKWKWIIGLGGLVILPLLVTLIIKALIATVAAFAIGVVVATVTPWLTAKWANRHALIFEAKINEIKRQAEEDPIASALYVLEEVREEAREAEHDIETFTGEYELFNGKLERFKKLYPTEAQKFEEMRQDFKAILDDKQAALEQMQQDAQVLEGEVEKAQAIYEMSMSAISLKEKAGQDAAKKVFQKIRLDTSLDTVQRRLGQARSQLKAQRARRAPTLELEHNPSPTLDANVVDVKVAEPVRRSA